MGKAFNYLINFIFIHIVKTIWFLHYSPSIHLTYLPIFKTSGRETKVRFHLHLSLSIYQVVTKNDQSSVVGPGVDIGTASTGSCPDSLISAALNQCDQRVGRA